MAGGGRHLDKQAGAGVNVLPCPPEVIESGACLISNRGGERRREGKEERERQGGRDRG